MQTNEKYTERAIWAKYIAVNSFLGVSNANDYFRHIIQKFCKNISHGRGFSGRNRPVGNLAQRLLWA